MLYILVTQSCLTLCNPMDCSLPGSSPWNSPGKNTGVGCHSLLQGIFPGGIQASKLGLLHCRQILHHLSHQGSPYFFVVVSYGPLYFCGVVTSFIDFIYLGPLLFIFFNLKKFFIHWSNLCHLIRALSPFTFKVIIDIYVFIAILLIVFWLLLYFILFHSFSFSVALFPCDLMTFFSVTFIFHSTFVHESIIGFWVALTWGSYITTYMNICDYFKLMIS